MFESRFGQLIKPRTLRLGDPLHDYSDFALADLAPALRREGNVGLGNDPHAKTVGVHYRNATDLVVDH
ncbi:MAG: hypothetical protein ABJB95_11455, partial [Gemmatimonadales bacterium]